MTSDERATIRQFLDALSAEEEFARRRSANDRLGISLRTAVNELDWFMYNYTRQQEPTREQSEQSYLISLGAAQLVRLMLREHAEFLVPTLTFRRQRGPFRQILEVVAQLGFIQHGRRVADSAAAGLYQVSKSETGRFEFILPARLLDNQAIERDVDEHFRRETLRLRQTLLADKRGRRLLKTINDLLEVNVFIFRENFMGYDADPLLDEYYFQTAWSDLRDTPGFDSFNELREFGGIRFLKYLLAVAYVNSLCLKHEAF